MADNNRVPSPVLALPPLEYDVQYLNNLVRLLNYYIEQTDNPGRVRGTFLTLATTNPKTNISEMSLPTPLAATAIVVGNVYTIVTLGTTNWNTVAGTTAVTYQIGSSFTAVVVGTGTGRVIAGSGPGTVWCDTAADYTLKIIP